MKINANFYDIESLSNIFTLCNYKSKENSADIFYLCDDKQLIPAAFEQLLLQRIYEKNYNFRGTIKLYDLSKESSNIHLAKTFGLSDAYMINDPSAESNYPKDFRLTCDTDDDYDENKHPYLMGYNSYNYDTTALAVYFYEVFAVQYKKLEKGPIVNNGIEFTPITANQMREHNNNLFNPIFKSSMPQYLTRDFDTNTKTWKPTDYSNPKWKIRKNMLLTGRHIDVARLNEKQSKVALKRLLGMLGYQILESDKLSTGSDSIETTDQLLDLIAYNMSDCVNLEKLFEHKLYTGRFTLKKALLKSYPELIYEQKKDAYAPNISSKTVRRDRLCIDSSSAQFSTKALCPYGHLKDMPVVSFMYPSKKKAKELGIKQVNVLEESKKFVYNNFKSKAVRNKFNKIYEYYKNIEGKNFNSSDNYMNDYANTSNYHEPYDIRSLPKTDMCMFYYTKEEKPSSCFVTFSTGGIHGAEYNELLYNYDVFQFEKDQRILEIAKQQYPDPIDLKKAKRITIDGIEYPASKLLKAKSTLKNASYKDTLSKEPKLFKLNDKGVTVLNTKYCFTSAAAANHEDFTSYYPNLLRMMEAFFNIGLGYDRYAEIFDNKQKYGKLMKDKSLSEEERNLYAILREGTKLILNSASGAGDANFESNIRMNNTIISMRIIGQLFSWRIGQAQTLYDAKIISTNTDGLYSVLDPKINDPILARESADIGVEIEPEPMVLISKDSNNRTEIDAESGEILSASGGTLGCRLGPDPTKSLTHPALIDWALTEYLQFASVNNTKKVTLSNVFNEEVGMNILLAATKEFEPRKFLQMAQNVIASSPGSITYIFGTTDDAPEKPIILQHYNRVFIMKDKTPNAMHLQAANAKKITDVMANKRIKLNMRKQMHNPLSVQVLNANGIPLDSLPEDKEAFIKKITNVEDTWYMLIQNKALENLSDIEVNDILNNLDFDKYLILLKDSFENNWRNKMPEDITENVA